ncbi:MAG: glycosyltransferase, partial [Rhodocyclaceae bacterium]
MDVTKQGGECSTIAILLCSMHGQHFIAEQLESIAAQTYPHWTVWISDDGSQDDTHEIIRQYQCKWG